MLPIDSILHSFFFLWHPLVDCKFIIYTLYCMFLHKFFHWYHIFFISFSLTWSIHRYITKIFYSYPYLLILFAQIQFKLFHFAYLGMDQTESNTAWCTDSFRNVRTKIEFVNFSKKNHYLSIHLEPPHYTNSYYEHEQLRLF